MIPSFEDDICKSELDIYLRVCLLMPVYPNAVSIFYCVYINVRFGPSPVNEVLKCDILMSFQRNKKFSHF